MQTNKQERVTLDAQVLLDAVHVMRCPFDSCAHCTEIAERHAPHGAYKALEEAIRAERTKAITSTAVPDIAAMLREAICPHCDFATLPDGSAESTGCQWCDARRAALRGSALPAVASFKPTHEHADGGYYELLGLGKAKLDSEWQNCAFYRNSEGMMFATDLLRWNARFMSLQVGGERG